MQPIHLALAALCLTAFPVAAQDFVYTNNDSIPNSVSAFSVGPTGVLSPIAGSPFFTGDNGTLGGYIAADRIVIVGETLYASNDGSGTISAFSLDPETGALTDDIPGSPFPAVNAGVDLSLAATPDGRFLYVGNNVLSGFSISPENRALTPLPPSSFPELTFPGFGIDGMKVSPDSEFLFVSEPFVSDAEIHVFAIGPEGTLTAVEGSPFSDGRDQKLTTAFEFTRDGSRLFATLASPSAQMPTSPMVIGVYDVTSKGTLTHIERSPFEYDNIDNDSNGIKLSPDERHLFVSNNGNEQFLDAPSVTVLDVELDGSLSPVAQTFPVGDTARYAAEVATNAAGEFLFVTSADSSVASYSIAEDGSLTAVPSSPFPTGGPGLLSLAAYPPPAADPAILLQFLTDDVKNLGLNAQLQSLLVSAINGNNPIGPLEAFIRAVTAWSDRLITPAEAEELIATAQQILELLDS